MEEAASSGVEWSDALREHLATCEACRAEAAGMRALDGLVAEAARCEPDAEAVTRAFRRAWARAGTRQRRPVLTWGAVAAALLAAFALGFWARGSLAPAPSSQPGREAPAVSSVSATAQQPPTPRVKIVRVEVPVVREKVVTRTVPVYRTRVVYRPAPKAEKPERDESAGRAKHPAENASVSAASSAPPQAVKPFVIVENLPSPRPQPKVSYTVTTRPARLAPKQDAR